MRNLFFPISVIILCYLIYYHIMWFISFHVVEENHFAFFTDYFPVTGETTMIELRVINLLLALLSGITFTLALKRSRMNHSDLLKLLLTLNILVILLGLWQVVFI